MSVELHPWSLEATLWPTEARLLPTVSMPTPSVSSVPSGLMAAEVVGSLVCLSGLAEIRMRLRGPSRMKSSSTKSGEEAAAPDSENDHKLC